MALTCVTAGAAANSWFSTNSSNEVTSTEGSSDNATSPENRPGQVTQGGPTPSDFGFPIPNPEPALPPGADAFSPPAYATSTSGPVVAEISKTADRDEVVSMTGVELDNATGFDVFSQAPSAPEGSVVSVNALRADDTAATMLLPASLPPWSMYLIWPEREGIRGKPFAINRTEAWWIGPDNAAAGTTISVYGRNLSRSNGTSTSFIYIKPTHGTGRYVPPVSVNPFKIAFQLPDLAAGSYEIWIHNGHGGRFGWPSRVRFPR